MDRYNEELLKAAENGEINTTYFLKELPNEEEIKNDSKLRLMHEIRKVLQKLEDNNDGHMEGEITDCIYYKMNNRTFAVEIRELTHT